MTKFICKECGYRFDSEMGKKCPYCSKESTEKEQNAEELIKDVEEILE